jgi:3',5'-nucleoside bisphosphate phosphatase
MIDLHVHSNASDGTLSPSALVAYALKKNLRAIALTDHDTVDGLGEALETGRQLGLEVVPGVEISAAMQGGTLHILGYYMDTGDAAFLSAMATLQQSRAERNPRIIEKLNGLGLKLTLSEVIEQAETGLVGRPHFAQVLLHKGYVKTIRQAFDRYLKKGAPAYVEKYRFEPRRAIAVISAAGGIPVLAHPATLGFATASELEAFVARMAAHGIRGIEAHYPDHTPGQTKLLCALAQKYRLLVTGGTDFHGETVKGIDIGSGRGSLNIPGSILDALKAARSHA